MNSLSAGWRSPIGCDSIYGHICYYFCLLGEFRQVQLPDRRRLGIHGGRQGQNKNKKRWRDAFSQEAVSFHTGERLDGADWGFHFYYQFSPYTIQGIVGFEQSGQWSKSNGSKFAPYLEVVETEFGNHAISDKYSEQG